MPYNKQNSLFLPPIKANIITMKKGIAIITVIATIAIIGFTSCKQTVEDAVQNTLQTLLYDKLKSGYWTIKVYKANQNDSTQIFTNWVTYFNDNNKMISFDTTRSPRDTFNGTWSSSSDVSHFNCSYDSTNKFPLNRLSDSWTIDENGTNLNDRVSLIRYTYGHKDSLVMIKHL